MNQSIPSSTPPTLPRQPTHNTANVCCDCGVAATRFTTNKPGPNHGRAFFKCGSHPQRCSFFLWEDESGNNPGGSSLFRNPGGSSLFRNPRESSGRRDSREPERGAITCFRCGKKGHMARDCPDAGRREPPPQTRHKPEVKQRKTTTKQRLCSVCKQPGHTKKTCPMARDAAPPPTDFQMDPGVDYGDMDLNEFQDIDWEM